MKSAKHFQPFRKVNVGTGNPSKGFEIFKQYVMMTNISENRLIQMQFLNNRKRNGRLNNNILAFLSFSLRTLCFDLILK